MLQYRKQFFLVLLLMVGVSSSLLHAQGVSRSSIIEQYKGKPYYMHFVKQGETLFSIAKAYQVSPEIIKADNPELSEPMRVDQLLRIPVMAENEPSKTETDNRLQDTKPIAGKDEVIYTVGKQETLYGISKKFNVSIEEILKINPGLEALKAGSQIRIPASDKTASPGRKTDDKILHHEPNTKTITVEKRETIYSICKKYEITEEVLRRYNPQLSEGLKEGQLLIIPVSTQPVVAAPIVNNSPDLESTQPDSPLKISGKDSVNCYRQSYSGRVFNVALLLPLNTEDTDSIALLESDPSAISSGIMALNFFPFYSGMLLAFDSLEKAGFQARIMVLDADKENDTMKIKRVAKKLEFDDIDLIIGPVYAGSSSILSRMAKGTGVNIVNPLTRRLKVVEGYPTVYKIQPQDAAIVSRLKTFLEKNFPSSNLIIIRNEQGEAGRLCDAFSKSVSNNPLFKVINIDYQKQTFTDISRNLTADRRNVVVLFSVNKSLVPNLISLLNRQADTYPISLFGIPGWESFDLETEALVNLDFHQLTTQFVDYDNPAVQEFIRKYRNRFNAEPSVDKFSFLGYDIAWFFGNALMNYGRNMRDCVPYLTLPGLQADFSFLSASPAEGNVNQSIKVIRLVDYKWREAR